MAKTRKKYSAEFKFKAVLRVIKEEETATKKILIIKHASLHGGRSSFE